MEKGRSCKFSLEQLVLNWPRDIQVERTLREFDILFLSFHREAEEKGGGPREKLRMTAQGLRGETEPTEDEERTYVWGKRLSHHFEHSSRTM